MMLPPRVVVFLRWFEIKYAVSFVCTLAMWLVGDAFVLCLIVGAVVNGVLGKILKVLLNQTRPVGPDSSGRIIKHDPGMPSGHANTIAFMVSLLSLFLRPHSAVVAGLYVTAGFFTWVRVSVLHVHTVAQVVVGFGLGSITGSILAVWLHKHSQALVRLNTAIDAHQSPLLILKVVLTICCLVYYAVEPCQWFYKRKRARGE
jgi:membrane-associated phospholipid phosphatase